jgi:hypothetical protein
MTPSRSKGVALPEGDASKDRTAGDDLSRRPDLHDLACVLHVHSTCSDGTGTVPEIAAAAAVSGVDAVLLTDHDTLEARRLGMEGWHGDVLVLVGNEISPKRGHLLAFGLDHEVPHAGRSEREICNAVSAAGGLGFLAHPFSEGSLISTRIGKPHGWGDLECETYTGVEVWSLLTDAAEAWAKPSDVLAFLRDPEGAIDHPPARNMAAWDRLCARRRTVAIGGLDAHQTGLRLRGRVLSLMRNERMFRLMRTHVLIAGPPARDPARDAAEIHAALEDGRCYLAVDALAPARGFAFWAERDGEALSMGGEAPAGDWTLRAELPREAELRLIRDGRVIRRSTGRGLEERANEPGVYRLEAHLERGGRGRTWIISNPVYLRPERVLRPAS